MISDSSDNLKTSICIDWWNEGMQNLDSGEEQQFGSGGTYWEKMKQRDLATTYERILLPAVTSPKVQLTAF
jgi:hypothetical protein